MCDMQEMPRDSCEEEDDMNFAAFSPVSSSGSHFDSSGQVPVGKMQQGMVNTTNLSQVVGMVGGVTGSEGLQYGSVQGTPQFISVPITLPGAKPGEPQPMVQIQVLNPALLQQQPKYQMQIPIQGFQQGGAMLTVAYSPEVGDNSGLQLMGQQALAENMQIMTAIPQELLMQPHQEDNKSQIQHQVFITPNQQIIINSANKTMNNNTTNNNNNDSFESVVVKEECDDANDDESSQSTEASDKTQFELLAGQQDLINYLNSLAPEQAQSLPLSLQQFLKLNPKTCVRKTEPEPINIEIEMTEKQEEAVAEAIIGEDGSLRIQNKKKKKYKKKPPKPARPRAGQVMIATAEDGTPIFCCPECQMAYPDKEQLEVHLGVHKIARRFICGICGAGLKRKEHLERHKLGHNPERPYVCGVCHKGFKRREHLNLHIVIHSGVKTEMCTECGKGFYRKDHLRKHARSHESKRAREDPTGAGAAHAVRDDAATTAKAVLPEITIHVPSSSSVQLPVQINIPQHVVSSLAAASTQQQHHDTQTQLEALLAQHS